MLQKSFLLIAVGFAVVFAEGNVAAQTVRLQPAPVFESTFQGTAQGSTTRDGLVPVRPSITTPITTTPVTPRTGTTFTGTASATLGQPTFDPYSTSPDAAAAPPSLFGTQPNPGLGGSSSPYWQGPGGGGTAIPGSPGFPSSPYPTQPPVLFPDGSPAIFPNGLGVPGAGNWPQAQPGPYLRLFQDVRFQYTWVSGQSGPMEMTTNDAEVGTTINFPNFLWSGRPLHVSPAFVFHFWDGPDTDPVAFPTELPARVYSTYVQYRWQPMLTPSFGGEVDVSTGVFSDFGKVDQDSIRVYGTGVFVLALTPNLVLKGGVNYLDRVDLKLLPAGGLLWTPNPQTRFDIFFPKPKLAQYLTTIGNTDVWWYINGEYGGGSWSVERLILAPPGPPVMITDDRRVDINDIRVGGGLEWTGHSGVRGFVEAAYVFDRELVFASAAGPGPRPLKDTIMVRGGLSY